MVYPPWWTWNIRSRTVELVCIRVPRCTCTHCAGCPLVAKPSVFSTVSTKLLWTVQMRLIHSDNLQELLIWTQVNSAHTHRWWKGRSADVTHDETRPTDELKEWKLLTPHVVALLKAPSSWVNLCWTCHGSDLHLAKSQLVNEKLSETLSANSNSALKWRCLSQGKQPSKRNVVVPHSVQSYKEMYTQKRGDSTCGLRDNYRSE